MASTNRPPRSTTGRSGTPPTSSRASRGSNQRRPPRQVRSTSRVPAAETRRVSRGRAQIPLQPLQDPGRRREREKLPELAPSRPRLTRAMRLPSLTDLHLSPLGLVHTVLALIAVGCGLVALLRHGAISPRRAPGKSYVIAT